MREGRGEMGLQGIHHRCTLPSTSFFIPSIPSIPRARFEDATFFYKEDLKQRLEEFRCGWGQVWMRTYDVSG